MNEMNHRMPFPRLFLLVLGLLVGAHALHAQLLAPFVSQRGLKTAFGSAQSSLGSDAVLLGVGTFGDFEYQGQSIQFSIDDGRANLWAYVFRSPGSGESKTIAVVSLGGLVFTPFDLPDSGLDVPVDAEILDSNDTYFNSSAMVGRVTADTAYVRFRAKYPDNPPLFVTLRTYTAADSIDLPGGFPVDQPLWTLVWLGGGDSSLVCAVASKTGETYCQRVELPASSVPDYQGVRGAAMVNVAPNPATGRVRVSLDLPEGTSTEGMTLLLFDARGEQVADLTGQFMKGDRLTLDIETAALPAGSYYLRAVGANWMGTGGVVVGK